MPSTDNTETEVTVTLTFPRRVAELLAALDDPEHASAPLAERVSTVLDVLADHAQQGVYRPGAWERQWLMQAFGDGFLERLEPDTRPESLSADGRVIFQRPAGER